MDFPTNSVRNRFSCPRASKVSFGRSVAMPTSSASIKPRVAVCMLRRPSMDTFAMTLLRDILKELVGMFLADAWLTGGILALVAIVAELIRSQTVEPLVGGGALLVGGLAILLAATRHEARRRRHPQDS